MVNLTSAIHANAPLPSRPLMCFPSMGKPSFITRFCPVLFHLPATPTAQHMKPAVTLHSSAPDRPTTGAEAPTPDPPCTPPKDTLPGTEPTCSPSLNGQAMASGEPDARLSLPVHLPVQLPFQLPYRMVLAVATTHSVLLFDTVTPHPIAVMAGLHYAPITDVAW